MKYLVFQGGLGNQIFQYGFYSYIRKSNPNIKYVFDDGNSHNGFELDKWFNVDVNKASCFARLLFLVLRFLRDKGLKNFIKMEEQYPKENGLFLSGYWQNKQYFNKGFISFKELPLSDKNAEVISLMEDSDSVAIHVRRGDYLRPPYDKIYGGICTIEYYKKAISIIEQHFENPCYFVFSDDIEWVKDNLNIRNAYYIDWNIGNNSVYDMLLMSRVKANIIANSTFSFWGAFLNKSNVLTVCPKRWFFSTFKDPDIIPDNWIKI